MLRNLKYYLELRNKIEKEKKNKKKLENKNPCIYVFNWKNYEKHFINVIKTN